MISANVVFGNEDVPTGQFITLKTIQVPKGIYIYTTSIDFGTNNTNGMKILLLDYNDSYNQSEFNSVYTISNRACLQYVRIVGNDGLSNVNLYFKVFQSSGSTINVGWSYRCVKISSNNRVFGLS